MSQKKSHGPRLSHAQLLELKRYNTPTVYNGWEQITRSDAGHENFNLEPTHDFIPDLGTLIGYAVTIVIEPGNPTHREGRAGAWSEYKRFMASLPGPKVVVVQDLDKPNALGAFWGEVNSSVHNALGCVGTITDGAVRDLDEMKEVGFKAIARCLCVGHAYSFPVRWGCEVEVFGCKVQPGQLIHADKHGFLTIPPEDEAGLLEAVKFMDANECQTHLPVARSTVGKDVDQILQEMDSVRDAFAKATKEKFGEKKPKA